jgi:hypothetical protein
MSPSNVSTHPRLYGALFALALIAALPTSSAFAELPCCTVAGIDKATGIVTLRDSKTGKLEKVTVKDPAQLAKLSVGQTADRSLAQH